MSVCPDATVTYSVGNGGKKNYGLFSETVPLQRSSTASLKAICTVSHFPVESVHAHYSIGFVVFTTRWHRGFCTLVHSLKVKSMETENEQYPYNMVFNGDRS